MMRSILQQRSLRFVFAANVISMLGSGMNAAAVAWYILKATHSETALGTLAVFQTVPAMLMLPFTGVIIDREDRRRLVLMLDAARALIIVTVAILAFQGKVRVWELYLMNMLVAAGFWMFWPTITALIRELTPDSEFIHANTFLLAGVQGGWLIAGAVVGFMYEHVGLGGVLLIDFLTYVASFLCYFYVRKGKHVVPRPAELRADIIAAETQAERFWRELKAGILFLRDNRNLALLGACWALFLAGMTSASVVTPSLSDRIFHAGAKGYGWLNAGWGVGAFLSVLYTAKAIAASGARRATAIAMGLTAIGMMLVPYSVFLPAGVAVYALMGSARGVGGVAMNTSLMEQVPNHFMGRVQNIFNFFGTTLQVGLGFTVGVVAHTLGLATAFAILGLVYVIAFASSIVPVGTPAAMATSAE
jgi:MFS family permease